MAILRQALEQTRDIHLPDAGPPVTLTDLRAALLREIDLSPEYAARRLAADRRAQQRERAAARAHRRAVLGAWGLRVLVCVCFALPALPDAIAWMTRAAP